MLANLTKKVTHNISNYLQTIYQATVKAQTPFFTINSSQIQIIQDPLDFYLLLKNSITQSSHRIGLSSLYLGTGTLQRHLLAAIANQHKLCPQLRTAMVFDYHRSQRQQHGESPAQVLHRFSQQVGENVQVDFMKQGKGRGVLGQIMGVHHQKIYLFDDRVILGGANLSKNYFLNRRDRYLSINSRQLSDYLFQYLQILSGKVTSQNLKTHYKLWKYAYMPGDYLPSFTQQLKSLKDIQQQRQKQKERSFAWQSKPKTAVMSRNQQIANQIGSSITQYQQIRRQQFIKTRQKVRDRLFTVGSEDYVNNELEVLGNPFKDTPVTTGEQVHVFPFFNSKQIQWPVMQQTHQSQVFKQVLMLAAKQNNLIRLSSGYLNLDTSLFKQVADNSNSIPAMQLLCSAPDANSFYRAGGVRNLVPAMYRCYEQRLLQIIGQKCQIKQFSNGQWSFHAKGLWVDQAQNSMVTVVGSSNFNARSKDRDSEFQFYMHSTCKDLNKRLNKQWQNIEKECKHITLDQIKNDQQIKTSSFNKLLAKWGSPWL